MISVMFKANAVREAAVAASRTMGYEGMKSEQLQIVESFVTGHDVFGVLPTGYGKSLCYACLPAVFDCLLQKRSGFSIVLVVSPLVALMKDQVASYSAKGLRAAAITGDSSKSLRREVQEGEYQLVYITPELLITGGVWRKMLVGEVYSERLRAFIVDEAHTVKKWGESFRSVMERLGEVRSLLPQHVNILALTATATKEVRIKVGNTLGMVRPVVVALSPCKKNLCYSVVAFTTVSETFKPLLDRLKTDRGACPRTIVYCQSFNTCADIYIYLAHGLGFELTEPMDAPNIPRFRLVDMFTSVTDQHQKEEIISLFTKPSQLRVVIATIAFGLGLDCPDVRQIIHVGLPEDIESYIQVTGRAGRDGRPALATLIKARTYHVCEKSMKEYAANTTVCRRDVLFQSMENYTHEHLGSNCMCCDICAQSCKCECCSEKFASFVVL